MPYYPPGATNAIEEVRIGGTSVGSRGAINLIAGSGVTLAGTDNPATGAVDVTVGAGSVVTPSQIASVGAYIGPTT